MATNKVVYGDQTLIDLTDSTLQSSDELLSGVTAYDRSGTLLTGRLTIGSSVFIAIYGATTYQEVFDAINAGKTILISYVKSGATILIQAITYRVDTTYIQFGVYSIDGYYAVIYLNAPNQWAFNVDWMKLASVNDIPKIDTTISDTSTNPVQNKVIKSYIDDSVTIDKIKLGNAELPIIDKTVQIPNYIYAITKTQYSLQAHNVNGVHDNSLTISKVSDKDRLKFLAWDNTLQEVVFDIDTPNANELGDLSLLTTDDKTSLVNALNEVYEKSGEPFRVKQWSSSWPDGITIPVCTKDISNTQIPKMVFNIGADEGASYQIVGMIAYEVFDSVSGGNRLNVWPVCQFTGNGQKELSVRFTCMGTQDKVAKRILAWVLLKHR